MNPEFAKVERLKCLDVADPSVQQSKDDRVPTEVIIGVTCAVFLVVIVVAIFIGYKCEFNFFKSRNLF